MRMEDIKSREQLIELLNESSDLPGRMLFIAGLTRWKFDVDVWEFSKEIDGRIRTITVNSYAIPKDIADSISSESWTEMFNFVTLATLKFLVEAEFGPVTGGQDALH